MMTGTIVPSPNLRVLTVHKMKDLGCWRRYYWRWVRNLESRALNLNYFYGAVLGSGFEATLMGKDWPEAMRAEDERRRAGRSISQETLAEMDLQVQLIEGILRGAKQQPAVQKMKLEKSQIPVAMRLRNGLLYRGMADGKGTYDGVRSLFEIKTASRVSAEYLAALAFDPQIYSYAMTPEFQGIGQCAYCVFQKPQKRVKKGQTIDEFIQEVAMDAQLRPNMYYHWHRVPLGVETAKANAEDVEAKAEILLNRYEQLGPAGVLDHRNWPKCPDKCFEYSGCEFLPLCKNAATWEYYLRMYQQREMLYEEEKEELATPIPEVIKKVKKVVKRKAQP